ncbi:MAG: nucleotidyltransferase family protein [Methanotrichaceae archaeon]|nr:nucleotidyltransferase family protein [Methanotrichaceae archaeon]
MDAIEILKEHETEIKDRFSVRRIGIFGSYARGEEKETSDVDVLVEFENPTFRNFMGLVFFLEELLGREVDLVTIKGLSPYIRPHVEGEVVWSE